MPERDRGGSYRVKIGPATSANKTTTLYPGYRYVLTVKYGSSS